MEDGTHPNRLIHSTFFQSVALPRLAITVAILALIFQTGCRPGQTNSGPFGFGNRSNSDGYSGGGIGGTGFGNSFGQGYANNSAGAPGSGGAGLGTGSGAIDPSLNRQYSQMAGEVSTLSQRLGAYDADNQLLNTEVAGLKQKLELANQYNQALKQQLADTSGRIKQTDFDRQSAASQVASLQNQVTDLNRRLQDQQRLAQQNRANGNGFAEGGDRDRFASNSGSGNGIRGEFAGFNNGSRAGLPGSATLRANNSLMRRLQDIQIPGGQTRMDGDVIRVEFPTDRMFVPGSYQIQPAQMPVIQNIAATIRQSFPRQIVGVEAHWDATPLSPPGTTDHQLTATQSLAVFDELVKLGLPRNQMFTMAMASNRPRHPQGVVGGVSPNRRIELVIYPESFDGT